MKKNNFGLIMESWRGYKKSINEITGVHNFYGRTYEEFRAAYDEIARNTFIFFDTETTGLGPARMYKNKEVNQITQIAAIAINPGQEGYESFNVKITLTPDTEWYKKDQEQAIKRGVEFPFTHKQAFSLTGYGQPSTARKALRKRAREITGKIEKAQQSAEERGLATEEEAQTISSRLIGALPQPTEVISLEEALTRFNEFVNQFPQRTLIAQNAPFDVDYFIQAYVRTGVGRLPDMAVDTVQIFNRFFKPILQILKTKKESGEQLDPADEKMLNALTKTYMRTDKKTGKQVEVKSLTVSLGPLAEAFGVVAEGWHDALSDVTMLHEILNKVLQYLDGNKDVVMALPTVEREENTELGPPVPGHLSKKKPVKPSDLPPSNS
jgi:DNA polymerase III epsilon subunit-like protein